MPAFLLVLVGFVLDAAPVAARDCRIFNQLMTLTLASEELHEYLRTGSNSAAIARMERFLSNTSKTELSRGMKQQGLHDLYKATETLMAQQRTLLNMLAIRDRRGAERTSIKLFARETVAAYRRDLARMPCRRSHNSGLNEGEMGALKALGHISSATAAAGSLGLVAIGALCFIIYERRMTILRRRRKRYSCNLDCTLRCNNEEAEATLLDISQEGAKIKSVMACSVGDVIALDLPDGAPKIDLGSRVQWSNANYFGVNFKEKLPREAVKDLTSYRRRGAAPPRPLRTSRA
ncbi:PilZ domain-containing protein [Phaeobacter porticola]|uniref:PilZ domain-containing protein n=1 Tax=Phaeobacter porticola TaxID=1844006 RepID=UPI001F27C834|nr:PilZ domain-containing protein [Phaeobacter porticola]